MASSLVDRAHVDRAYADRDDLSAVAPQCETAAAPDLLKFADAVQKAQTVEQVKLCFFNALSATDAKLLQLARYRRLHFAEMVWDEHDARSCCDAKYASVPLSDAFACRAIASARPELWNFKAAITSGLLHQGGQRTNDYLVGATISIVAHNDVSLVFTYASKTAGTFAAGATEGCYAALSFLTAQKLIVLERRSPYRESFHPILSAREREVLRWSKDGKSYPEIAQILGISTKTVEYHMANAMKKFGVNQKISAIVAAARLALIEL